MQSLRDKLLKAGVVSEQDAKRAEEAKAKDAAKATEARARRNDRTDRSERRPTERPPVERRPDERRSEERRPAPVRESVLPKFTPLAGSAAASRDMARKQLELDRKIRDLVAAAHVPVDIGATVFYFMTRKNRLRKMHLTEPQATLIREGKLAIVERPEPAQIEHSLVPPEVAEQLLALSAKAVRFLNRPGAQVGFLSDDEIHRRASEADAPEATEPAESAASPETPPATESAPPAEGPWITIRRSPIGGEGGEGGAK